MADDPPVPDPERPLRAAGAGAPIHAERIEEGDARTRRGRGRRAPRAQRPPADPSIVAAGLRLARFSAVVQFALPATILVTAAGAQPGVWNVSWAAAVVVYTVASWAHALGLWHASKRLPWEPGSRRTEGHRPSVRLCLVLSTLLSIAGGALGIASASAGQRAGFNAPVFLWSGAVVFAQAFATAALYLFMLTLLVEMAEDTMRRELERGARTLRKAVLVALAGGAATAVAGVVASVMLGPIAGIAALLLTALLAALAITSYAALARLVEKAVRMTDAELSRAGADGTIHA